MSLTQDHTEPFGVLRTSDKKEEPSFDKGKAEALAPRHESWQLAVEMTNPGHSPSQLPLQARMRRYSLPLSGPANNMKAVEQAGECLFSDTKVSQMRGGRRVYCSSHSEQ